MRKDKRTTAGTADAWDYSRDYLFNLGHGTCKSLGGGVASSHGWLNGSSEEQRPSPAANGGGPHIHPVVERV